MTPDEARTVLENELRAIVPDVDLAAVPADADLREFLELDSLDFLALTERLSLATGTRITEDDAASLRTVDSAARFLAEHSTVSGA